MYGHGTYHIPFHGSLYVMACAIKCKRAHIHVKPSPKTTGVLRGDFGKGYAESGGRANLTETAMLSETLASVGSTTLPRL